MNKVLAIIIALLPLMAEAQYFTLTAQGWKSAEDNTSDYIVIPMEGTKAELFQKTKTAVTATFKSAKDVMSFNEPDIININGYTDCFKENRIGMKFFYGMDYTMQILFKDGKIRINAPNGYHAKPLGGTNKVNLFLTPGGGGFFDINYYVFNNKGELKKKEYKKQAEDYFNSLIYDIIEKAKNGAAGSDDDW